MRGILYSLYWTRALVFWWEARCFYTVILPWCATWTFDGHVLGVQLVFCRPTAWIILFKVTRMMRLLVVHVSFPLPRLLCLLLWRTLPLPHLLHRLSRAAFLPPGKAVSAIPWAHATKCKLYKWVCFMCFFLDYSICSCQLPTFSVNTSFSFISGCFQKLHLVRFPERSFSRSIGSVLSWAFFHCIDSVFSEVAVQYTKYTKKSLMLYILLSIQFENPENDAKHRKKGNLA